jgi:ribosome-associated protein
MTVQENATAAAAELTPRDFAIIAARAADEKKATDIIVQDVGDIISVTEYFVIVTAANNRQVNAIVDAIEEAERKEAHIKPIHREETRDGSWELLDYGSVVVHVFQPETREYYRLEALWNDAPILDLAAEAGIDDAVYSDRIAAMLGSREEAAKLDASRQDQPEEGGE